MPSQLTDFLWTISAVIPIVLLTFTFAALSRYAGAVVMGRRPYRGPILDVIATDLMLMVEAVKTSRSKDRPAVAPMANATPQSGENRATEATWRAAGEELNRIRLAYSHYATDPPTQRSSGCWSGGRPLISPRPTS